MGIEIWLDVDEAFAGEVDNERIATVVTATLDQLGVTDAEMGIAVTTDEEIQGYNRDYRGVDAATDVLSFPAQESGAAEAESPRELPTDMPTDLPTDLPEELRAEIDRHLGDIMIAYPYAQRQAQHYGNSAGDELLLLAVHGTLHLLGYDHATPADEAEMWALQEEILAPWGVKGLSQRVYEGD